MWGDKKFPLNVGNARMVPDIQTQKAAFSHVIYRQEESCMRLIIFFQYYIVLLVIYYENRIDQFKW
jgi:hypothetical protein